MTVGSIVSVPGARPIVELGVGNTNTPAGQAIWDTARWDTEPHRWAGTEPTWLDITCDVHDVEIDQGRDRSIVRWQVGTASITLDNRDGRYDINVTPTPPAVLSVRPGRQIRVGVALDGGEPHWLCRGLIDAANPTYDPVLQDVVELSCIDAKGMAGKVDLGKLADPGVGASETVTARMNRVLDAAGWQAHYRDIPAAGTTLLATTMGAKCVDLLDVAADSVGGVVFGDEQGRVTFRGRDWQTYEPDVPVDDTIGNLPATGIDIVYGASDVVYGSSDVVWTSGDPQGVCPSGWEMSFEADDMATRVLLGRPSEEPHIFDDADNQILYGVETFSRTDLIPANPADLDLLGARILRVLSASFMPNVAAVTIDAATSVAARDLCRDRRPDHPLEVPRLSPRRRPGRVRPPVLRCRCLPPHRPGRLDVSHRPRRRGPVRHGRQPVG